MAKTVLLILFLILIAFFSGRTLMLASNLFSGKRTDFFSSFSIGTLMVILISFASHFITLTRTSLLGDEKRLCGIIIVALMTVSYFAFVVLTVVTGKRKKEDENAGKKAAGSARGWVFFCIAAVLSILCFMTVVSGKRINSLGDETLETVVSFLDRDAMYSADPLTGMPYREGLPGKQKILCLPGMYAVMASAFGTSPEVLVHKVMPGFWFVAGLVSMIALSGAVFRVSADGLFKRSVFIASGILFIYASDLSLYSQGFAVLSSMWTGTAIRIWVLVPVLLFLLFEKKYIMALLPVACEAFICRTVYGAGFLACIYAGWILVSLIMGRVKCSKAS